MDRQELVPIGRFAVLSGLTVTQLRHYDRVGLLSPAERARHSGYRYYTRGQAAAARVIALLRSIDVPLADVHALLADPSPERIRGVFADHRARIERRLDAARAALQLIDGTRWEEELMLSASDTRCSFCNRSEAPVAFRRDRVAICETCVALARHVLELDRRGEGPPVRRRDPSTPREPVACSFCGRDQTAVRKLVAGPQVFICDGCLGDSSGSLPAGA